MRSQNTRVRGIRDWVLFIGMLMLAMLALVFIGTFLENSEFGGTIVAGLFIVGAYHFGKYVERNKHKP